MWTIDKMIINQKWRCPFLNLSHGCLFFSLSLSLSLLLRRSTAAVLPRSLFQSLISPAQLLPFLFHRFSTTVTVLQTFLCIGLIAVPLIIPALFWQAFHEENGMLLDLKGLLDLATLVSVGSGALVPAGILYSKLGLREHPGKGTSRKSEPGGGVPQAVMQRLSPGSDLGGVNLKVMQTITNVHKPLYKLTWIFFFK